MTSSRKIQIRPSTKIRIRVSEKSSFTCQSCSNKYYSFFYFCPQCLGRLTASPPRLAVLRIISLPKGKEEELAGILQFFSGKKDFDFAKVLRSLPWSLIQETDAAVLQHWKEVLEAQGAETEMEMIHAAEQPKRRKASRVLFAANAPLPFLFPPTLDNGVRKVAQMMHNAALRLQWVELVGIAFRIIESSYKYHADQRILFSDLLYKIEQELQTAVQDFHSYYRTKEEEFPDVIRHLKSSLEEVDSEIQAVRRQVQEQL